MPLHLQSLLGFSTWFSPLLNTSKLQLAPSNRSHKLWCQARALLAPVTLATKMSASKLICYFSGHPAAFNLTPANRKADWSLSGFQTCIGAAAAHATLDIKQLISCLRAVLNDSISSLPDSEGGFIHVPEVHELLTKVHDITDDAVSI